MNKMDPDKVRVILATDCGSTTTKAILIQKVDGVYRQTHRGEAPTTVEAPSADVTLGVVNAVTEVQDRWYSPDAMYFRVIAQDGHCYVLRHALHSEEQCASWTLEAFRAVPAGEPR